jgi:hypothetical protein
MIDWVDKYMDILARLDKLEEYREVYARGTPDYYKNLKDLIVDDSTEEWYGDKDGM